MRTSPRDRIELRIKLSVMLFLFAAVVFSLSLWRTNTAHKRLRVLMVEASKVSNKVAQLEKEVRFLSSLKPEEVVLFNCSEAVFVLDGIVNRVFPVVGYKPKLVWKTRGNQILYAGDLGLPDFGYLEFDLRVVGAYNYYRLRNTLQKLLGMGAVMVSAEYGQNRLVLGGRLYCRGLP